MDKRFIRRERSSEVEAAEESEEEFEVKVTQSKETMLGIDRHNLIKLQSL